MRLAVRDTVGRAIVAGRDRDRDAESCGRLEHLVHRIHGLLSPLGLGGTPAYRDDRGLVGLVMDRLADRIDEAGIRVGREIDGKARARCGRGRDLDIENDLAIGTVRAARRLVLGLVDADGDDRG